MDQVWSLDHFQLSTVFCFQVFVESQRVKLQTQVRWRSWRACLRDTTQLAPPCSCLSGERRGVYVPRRAGTGWQHTGRKHAALLFSHRPPARRHFLSSPADSVWWQEPSRVEAKSSSRWMDFLSDGTKGNNGVTGHHAVTVKGGLRSCRLHGFLSSLPTAGQRRGTGGKKVHPRRLRWRWRSTGACVLTLVMQRAERGGRVQRQE